MRNFVEVGADQRSPAWFTARLGRLTGSVAGDMLAKTKTSWSASRRNLCLRLVLERVTGKPQENGYLSPAMQAGIDREPLAYAAYEALTGEMAQRTGFLAHTQYMAGCSLDGHVGDFEKLVSLKCRQPAAHYEFLKTGAIPADAMAQIRHELWVTGAQAHDYFSWNPDFPLELQSRLVTVSRAEADIPGYEALALAFLAEVDAEFLALRTISNPTAVLQEVIHAV